YLGTNFSMFYYSEPDIDVSHTGTYFPGFVGRIEFDNPSAARVYARAGYTYQTGKYDYNGYVQSFSGVRRPYTEAALPQTKQTFEFMGGAYVGNLNRNILVKLIGGVEFEQTTDNAYTANKYFYKRARDTYFGMIGIGLCSDIAHNKSFEFRALGGTAVSGYHTTRLSDVGGIFASAPELRQKQTGGLRINLSATYKYEKLWFQPYATHTRLGATATDKFCVTTNCAVTATVNEPANQTTEFGINLGVWF
ncbi:MAG: hypothetical protein FWG18_03925, partial [Alphaproteobacteria bacterium]|nr:hypothetical protein [Alphaproteobacteria bacterium]